MRQQGGKQRKSGSPRFDHGAHAPGFATVEIVISIVLIGIVAASVLAAVRVNIIASTVIQDAAGLETALLNAADRADRATIRDCDYQNEVSAGAPDGFVITVHEEMLVDNPTGDPATDWVPCAVPVQAFDVERLTITATHADGKITRTMTVVKSDVD
jgi:type II secretory pathway pseudopilin PulG